ncbi:MAG: sel1 repeat family protein, partial [Sulfuricurvum sp.]|nr:sel1 repeat family protein [Sulfuricurvum sp.]
MLQTAFDAFNTQDFSKARELFEILSAQNNPTALSSLGYLYQQGLGVEKSPQQAYEYYTRAADLEEPTALFNLALMYADGIVVTHDQFKTHELLIRSAVLNFPQAQYEAALSLERGLGCVQNFSEAAFWYEEAAKRGHAGAFNN